MKRTAALIFLLCLPALPALAQLPSANIFFGYSYEHAAISAPPIVPDVAGVASTGSAGLNGWNASLEGKLLPLLGVVADFSGHYGSPGVTAVCGFINLPCRSGGAQMNTTVYHFLVGPQLSFTVGKVRPLAHALLGAGRVSESVAAPGFAASDTAFAYALGGGVDYRLLGPLRWRVQGDFLRDRFFSGSQNNFRFSTGPVLHF